MSKRDNVALGPLVIASGQTTSNAVTGDSVKYLSGFTLWGPGTLSGTITVEVSYDGTNYGTFQSAGADIEIAAGKVVAILAGGILGLRVKSSTSEGGARTFYVRGTEGMKSV